MNKINQERRTEPRKHFVHHQLKWKFEHFRTAMTEDASAYEEEVYHNSIKGGSKNIDPRGNITKRRVQFSEPLEYWREYDKETGELCEEKNPGEQQESIQYCGENVDKLDQSDIEERNHTESQTELIQSFNKLEDPRIGAQRQIKEKRKECSVESKQNVKLDTSCLHKKQLTKNSPIRCLEESSKASGKINLNLRGACPLLQKYCVPTAAVSTSLGKKPSPLPLGFNRKIYDERLLPSSFKSGNKNWNSSSKTGETGTGLPPVVGNVRTPHIVQLFD